VPAAGWQPTAAHKASPGNGFGKRTKLADYRLQSRGGKGVINKKTSTRGSRNGENGQPELPLQ
jgi:DNA gyrase/topoisomerase IV subunit A